MAENKAIVVDFRSDAPTATLGDATRLQQVVWNLLTNAIKFTPAGGHIDISLQSEHNHTILSIEDTGVGIAAEFLPYVFESFRQADGSSTRRFGGLGLGLAISRHLVELHGGMIEVRSSGTGQGSIFTVKLPNAQGQIQTDSPARIAQIAQPCFNNVRILIVDDEPDARDLLRFVLEDGGATVTAVESVAAAIVAIEDHNPDLIVSDLGMPDADGFDLIRYVRSRLDFNGILLN